MDDSFLSFSNFPENREFTDSSENIFTEYGFYYQNLPQYMESLNMNTLSVKDTIPSTSSETTTTDAIPSTSKLSMDDKVLSNNFVDFCNNDDSDDSEAEEDDDEDESICDISSNIIDLNKLNKNDENQDEKLTRRSLPSRKSKENQFLHQCKNRVIKKPKKLKTLTDIKKIYLQKTLNKRLKNTKLETIFEEPINTKNGEMKFLGRQKLRRSISLSDGLNINKATKKSRLDRIKKYFGKKKVSKKIPLETVINKLKNNNIDSEEINQIIPFNQTDNDNNENKNNEISNT